MEGLEGRRVITGRSCLCLWTSEDQTQPFDSRISCDPCDALCGLPWPDCWSMQHTGYTTEQARLSPTCLLTLGVEAVTRWQIPDAQRLALGLVRAEQTRDDQNQRLSTLQAARLRDHDTLVRKTAKPLL